MKQISAWIQEHINEIVIMIHILHYTFNNLKVGHSYMYLKYMCLPHCHHFSAAGQEALTDG